MGLYLKLNTEDEPSELATVTGWGDVGKWVNSLPPKTADTLVHLFHFGWSQKTAELSKEISAALKSHEPKPDVEETLNNLLVILKSGGDDLHCVVVTNGMSE